MNPEKAHAYMTSQITRENNFINDYPEYAAIYDDTIVFGLGTPSSNYKGIKLNKFYRDFIDTKVSSQPWINEASSLANVEIIDEMNVNYAHYWFKNFNNLKNIQGLSNLKGLKEINGLFYGAGDGKTEYNFSDLNVSECYSFNSVFYGANMPYYIWSPINCSKGQDFSFMFYKSNMGDTININGYNMISATNISQIFGYSKAKYIYINSANWECPSLKNAYGVFIHCNNLIQASVNFTKASQVTNYNALVFQDYKLTKINGIENINTSSAIYMDDAFNYVPKLSANLSGWNVNNVKYARNFIGGGTVNVKAPSFKPGTLLYW